MFNMQKRKRTIAQQIQEKYNQENKLGPKSDENPSIPEKKFPHRDGFEQTITEDQLSSEQKLTDSTTAQVVEKELESASSPLVDHRSDAAELSVPPINAIVEQIRQKRSADYIEDKDPHWSHTFNEKKQQGSLPKWKKNAPQHDKPVLNNDPQRFSTTKNDIKPLIGNITTADVDKVAHGIKTGRSADYDTAMLAILRLANDERRELTEIERRTIVDLKIARTNKLMGT